LQVALTLGNKEGGGESSSSKQRRTPNQAVKSSATHLPLLNTFTQTLGLRKGEEQGLKYPEAEKLMPMLLKDISVSEVSHQGN